MQTTPLRTTRSCRRTLLFLLALGKFFMPAVYAQNSEVSNTTTNGCYTNLRSLNADLMQKSPFDMETFTLCPDTVFEVGDNHGIELGFVNGDEPLRPRSNAIFRCGESGSSQNNCTIRGGDAQFQMFLTHHPESVRENVVVQGITYESVSPTRVALAIVAPGYIEFRDCVFKYHSNAQVAAILYQPIEVGDILEVTFDACLFENNSLFRDGSTISSALIGGGSSITTLIIRNSVFANNNLKDDLFFRSDVVEMQSGGSLRMENNCFFNNDVTGDGVVRVLDGGDVLGASGNFGTRIEGADCDFLVVEKESSCRQYDFPQCVLNYTNGLLIPPGPGFAPERPLPITEPSVATSAAILSIRWLTASTGLLLVAAVLLFI